MGISPESNNEITDAAPIETRPDELEANAGQSHIVTLSPEIATFSGFRHQKARSPPMPSSNDIRAMFLDYFARNGNIRSKVELASKVTIRR